jgi:hypothetical protein
MSSTSFFTFQLTTIKVQILTSRVIARCVFVVFLTIVWLISQPHTYINTYGVFLCVYIIIHSISIQLHGFYYGVRYEGL